jgi:very-short-patch-repair endonuclease
MGDRLKWVDDLLEAKRLTGIFNELESLAKALYGHRWQGLKSDWDDLTAASGYMISVHKQIMEGTYPKAILDYLCLHVSSEVAAHFHKVILEALSIHGKAIGDLVVKTALNESLRFQGKTLLHIPFQQQIAFLTTWADNISQIHLAISWNNLTDVATEENLLSMTTVAESWPGAKDYLKIAVQKTWYEYLLQKAINSYPALRKFERTSHEEVIKQYKRLDALNFQYNRARAALRHWEGMPALEGGGQVTVIRTEFNKKARHLSIRKLMKEAGLAIQAIKPVFMMSPLSIANFLPSGALQFDLVIFDEASQVRPVEALGALLRGKQLVVVGDTKQLPPTSFFDTMNSDWEDEESITADLPSILGMCDAQGAPQRMLRWHYRSRHESLIHLSNHHFYENKLVVFPSPGSKHHTGLFFHHLKDTAYDRGNTRTNPKEAEIVADAVLQHARKHPGLSLGVVAFSTAQREAIQDALEIRRKDNPDVEAFFKSHAHEPFFIKNLENVQGDERDVIFISIGYGRTAEGYVSMSFGPLNNEGGEKRLNVLITRAKLRCEVFTNLTAGDLDTSRTKSHGVIALKSFLHYAQHGQLNIPQDTGRPADSPFEEAVAQELVSLGYIVRKQVGSQGFYIDLAIVDPENPGRYILGIECDGAAYHSARSARDRDRLRQQVLEAMGWKMHRVWSTDWFRNPERELKRVIEAIDQAWKATLSDDDEEEEVVVETALVRESITDNPDHLPLYQLAVLPASIASQEIHRHPVGKLANWVEQVIEIESPVHFEEVARRIVEAAGVTRIGPRIKEHIKLAAKFAVGNGRIAQKGDFLWLAEMQQPMLRDRSELPPASRKLKYIAPEEIRMAVEKVVQDAVAISPEAAVPFVARMFGITRITEDMRKELLEIIEEMIAQKAILRDGELLKARN